MRGSIVLSFIQIIIMVINTGCRGNISENSTEMNIVSKHKTYNVSINGNDNADGSFAKPLKTISAAAKMAMPGDVITVHAGVYREQITPPRGGNSAQEPIVYEAAPGEKVEIKGSEIIKGWKKLDYDTWVVKIPNSFFGKFNPYNDLIRGDWFTPKGREHHTGCVYLNGHWLMEAVSYDDVMKPADTTNLLWYGKAESDTTTIWAQFKSKNPNEELVEINVRQTIFYPDKPFINFIVIRGFAMQHAATNWAPPTAEQMGLIGTHWSRGWVIENNVIQYSKCSGIALGKYGDEWDNNHTESAEGYVGTIKRALGNGWNKGTIGGHLVRNNVIAYCEQTGIVGSMGCAFSIIQGNTIHDIHIKRLFSGAEMAGIKFHGAVDVQITGNHIYRSDMGIWLDWMAQGTHVANNLIHDNLQWDLFLEVDHGPTMVYNNLLLSKVSVLMNSSGAVFAHNLIAGKIEAIPYDSRLTPYHKPHSTFVVDLHDNPSGDIQFRNNLFVNDGSTKTYDSTRLANQTSGNVYVKGTEYFSAEKDFLYQPDFDPEITLTYDQNSASLEIKMDKSWMAAPPRKLVTTELLGKAIVPELPFENTDGSLLVIDTDYFGNKRNKSNPAPGPFESWKNGKQTIKIWPIR